MPRRNKNATETRKNKKQYDLYGKKLLNELQQKQLKGEIREYNWHNNNNESRE